MREWPMPPVRFSDRFAVRSRLKYLVRICTGEVSSYPVAL